MQDEGAAAGTTEGQPQTARPREDDWIRTPIEDRYAAGMRIAADARYVRARLAASKVIQLARRLADDDMPADVPEGDPMWDVRGENRRRETFADPRPDDFQGTGKLPAEYPH